MPRSENTAATPEARGARGRVLTALAGTLGVAGLVAAAVVVPATPAPARTAVTADARLDRPVTARPAARGKPVSLPHGGRARLQGKFPGKVRRPYVVRSGGRVVVRGRTATSGRFGLVFSGGSPGVHKVVVAAPRHRRLPAARRTFRLRVRGTSTPTPQPSATVAPSSRPTAAPTSAPTVAPTAEPTQVPLTLQPTPTSQPGDALARWVVPQVSARTGQRLVVAGTVSGAVVSGRPVEVQQQLGATWHTMATATTGADGAYRVEVAAEWIYRTPARVVVPAVGGAEAATSTVVTIASVPGWSPAGSDADWTRLGGIRRWRWDPCTPVNVRLNLSRAPGVVRDATLAAIADVAEATGLDLRIIGDTDVVPWPADGRPYPADTQLVIAYGPQELTTESVAGSILGFGGISSGRTASDALGAVSQARQGGVFLDSEHALAYGKALNLVRHELGHAVGLGHASSTTQMMYRSMQLLDRFGAGDLAGFGDVGRMQGCIQSGTARAGVAAAEGVLVPPAPMP